MIMKSDETQQAELPSSSADKPDPARDVDHPSKASTAIDISLEEEYWSPIASDLLHNPGPEVVSRPPSLKRRMASAQALPQHSSSPPPCPVTPFRHELPIPSIRPTKRRKVNLIERPRATLEQILESIGNCLPPSRRLDDNIVNVGMQRLVPPDVFIVDSLRIKSQAPAQGLQDYFNKSPMVLLPVCDDAVDHWRLYCWKPPGIVELYDSAPDLPNTTTNAFRALLTEVTGNVLRDTVVVNVSS